MRPAPKRYSSLQVCLGLSLLALGAFGCGSSVGGGPCAGDEPDPACEVECSRDGDCPAGFYCGDDGTCTADCSQGGGECGPGEVCDGRGHCVASDGDGMDAGCPRVDVALEPQTPTVMLLIDRSGSMTTDFDDDLDRWEAVQEALTNPTTGVVTQLEGDVIFGASLYNSLDDDGDTVGDDPCPILQTVDPALNNAGPIGGLFSSYGPQQNTPTAESVDATVASFPQADGPRLIVLATDGDPDNCEDVDAHDQSSQTLTETAVENAYSQGIETVVLSVGTEVTESHLQRVANAGRGEPLDSGTEPFYVADNQQDLIDSFDQILTGVRTCEIEVEGTVDLDKADEGTVILNGTELEHGTDWQMLDESTLELLGGACDTFLETPNVDLEANFPCGTVVL